MIFNKVTRPKFVQLFTAGALSFTLGPRLVFSQEKKPPLGSELVKEFVIAGHGNLEKTKQMLEVNSSLSRRVGKSKICMRNWKLGIPTIRLHS